MLLPHLHQNLNFILIMMNLRGWHEKVLQMETIKKRGICNEAGDCAETAWKIAGWIGATLVIWGYYLNANMYAGAWLVWAVGNGIVAAYSFYKKAHPTAVMSLVIFVMNIYGYFKWS